MNWYLHLSQRSESSSALHWVTSPTASTATPQDVHRNQITSKKICLFKLWEKVITELSAGFISYSHDPKEPCKKLTSETVLLISCDIFRVCFFKERGPDHPSSAQGAGRAVRGWNHRANAERPQVCYASRAGRHMSHRLKGPVTPGLSALTAEWKEEGCLS